MSDSLRILFLVIVCAVVAALFFAQGYGIVEIGSTTLFVELAKTPQSIEQGLGGRDRLLFAQGMLFILPRRTIPSFWMKNMRFPIDIVWIDDQKVVDVHKDVVDPTIDTPDEELPLFRPSSAVTYVLELPAGEIERRQIHVGDIVRIRVP